MTTEWCVKKFNFQFSTLLLDLCIALVWSHVCLCVDVVCWWVIVYYCLCQVVSPGSRIHGSKVPPEPRLIPRRLKMCWKIINNSINISFCVEKENWFGFVSGAAACKAQLKGLSALKFEFLDLSLSVIMLMITDWLWLYSVQRTCFKEFVYNYCNFFTQYSTDRFVVGNWV